MNGDALPPPSGRGRDPLDEIAMLIRDLTYSDHVTLAAGLQWARGIEPNFGVQQEMANALHRWAQAPPHAPPVATYTLPSPAAAPPAPKVKRGRRKKSTSLAAPPPSPTPPGAALSRRDDVLASDATGVPSAATPPEAPE